MKICVIVYSQTGNTLSVAEKLKDALAAKGCDVELQRVVATGGDPGARALDTLVQTPDPNGYDALVFASPVQAFSLAQAMQLYLSQISCTQAGTVCCLVTQHFKKPWLGGNRAIRKMCALLARKNIPTSETGIVNWSGVNREAQIDEIVLRFSTALTEEA
jgi:menaquinone-dependent protoporphyrinogen IX oxidase